jgi:hypothetical protein
MGVLGKFKFRVGNFGSRGDMSLEYVFKILIMVVVLIVIIMLINQFKDQISMAVQSFICKFSNTCSGSSTDQYPKSVEQDYFTSGEIATYIDDCLSTNLNIPESDQKDIVCYTLLAKNAPYFRADKNSILSSVQSNLRDKVTINTDFTRQYVKIEFEDVTNSIIVS